MGFGPLKCQHHHKVLRERNMRTRSEGTRTLSALIAYASQLHAYHVQMHPATDDHLLHGNPLPRLKTIHDSINAYQVRFPLHMRLWKTIMMPSIHRIPITVRRLDMQICLHPDARISVPVATLEGVETTPVAKGCGRHRYLLLLLRLHYDPLITVHGGIVGHAEGMVEFLDFPARLTGSARPVV